MTDEELNELSKEDKIALLTGWIKDLDEEALDELIEEFLS